MLAVDRNRPEVCDGRRWQRRAQSSAALLAASPLDNALAHTIMEIFPKVLKSERKVLTCCGNAVNVETELFVGARLWCVANAAQRGPSSWLPSAGSRERSTPMTYARRGFESA